MQNRCGAASEVLRSERVTRKKFLPYKVKIE